MVYEDAETTALRLALCQEHWFGACPPALQDALLAHGRLRRLASGETLYARGVPSEHALYCVVEGALCIGTTDSKGLPSLLVYLEPHHWFGELPLIDGLPRTHDAVADGATAVLCVPQTRLQGWLDTHPAHWRDIARLAAGKLRVAYQVLGEPGSLPQRLARRLWLVAHGFGSRGAAPRLRLNLSQEQLAHMLGASRQSINMALRSLEQVGVIAQHYRSIEVLDIEALRLSAICAR
ncbi:hypothetical protein ASE39_24470 [Acidovorax sp. Root267]|uniref:Crp/Fnr family transcriptional regulator n=1 Tax=Acidovorax sp. Root267 TaxID=1736505 RepID=UPI0007104F7B|nr:Crp/Fnr family transcriptional regulator [Acidovorax sp. Root267]KRD23582.1 hypothetical protein ASE39_24470 [Acidovorax sp. Root267]